METSRRDLVRMAAVGAGSLVLGSLSPARAAGLPGVALIPGDDWKHKVSRSVLTDATDMLAKAVSGPPDVERYRMAGFAARMLVNHLNETGFTAEQQKEFGNAHLDPQVQIPALADAIAARGVKIDRAVFDKMAAITPERLEAARAYVESRGLHNVLREAAERLERSDVTRPERGGGAEKRFRVESQDWLDDWCKGADMLSDALTAIAVMFGAGCAMGCAVCCPIAIAIGIFVAFFDLAVDYICW